MKSLTGPALDWAITFAAGFGFLLFGYGKSFVLYYSSQCITQA
jgi:hypothetical protein